MPTCQHTTNSNGYVFWISCCILHAQLWSSFLCGQATIYFSLLKYTWHKLGVIVFVLAVWTITVKQTVFALGFLYVNNLFYDAFIS